MRISSDHESPDYHQVANFVDLVTVNGARLRHCISVDTQAGTAVVITQPMGEDPENPGSVKTHVVKGKIDIIWRSVATPGSQQLFLRLKNEWEERETVRILAQSTWSEP